MYGMTELNMKLLDNTTYTVLDLLFGSKSPDSQKYKIFDIGRKRTGGRL